MTCNWFKYLTAFRERRFVLSWLVLLIGFSFFVYRYLNSELWIFISDEPVFLSYSRSLVRSHTFATYSPLMGTQGVHYGPAALWLYCAVHAFLGPNVETHLLVMLTLFTASNAAVAYAIGRLYGDRYVVPATLGVLVASSPYQFFWSRAAWDPLANVCTGFIVALLCTRQRLPLWRTLVIGSLIGFGVSTHPAMVPLSLVALLMVFCRSPLGKRIQRTVLTAIIALVINLPYLSYLASTNSSRPSARKEFSIELVRLFFPEALRVSSLAGIKYFFDDDWTIYRRFSPFFVEVADYTAAALPWLAVAAFLGLLWALWFHRLGAQRTITIGAIVVWVGYSVFYSYLRLDPHPHYQFSIWWAMLVPLAGVLGWLKRNKLLFTIGVVSIWGVALLQCAFIVNWMQFVQARGGTRGVHYDSPISQQRRAVREVCKHTRSTAFVTNRTFVIPVSLDYLASTEPSCSGKVLKFVSETRRRTLGEERFVLQYAGPNTARLKVVRGN